MANRRHRSPARWLAPLALVICAVAVYAVVDNTLRDDEPSTGSDSQHQAKPTTTPNTRTVRGSKRKRTYVVKSGDTLSAISIKTGVPLQTIQRLNPKLDADTLRAGQKVRLAP